MQVCDSAAAQSQQRSEDNSVEILTSLLIIHLYMWDDTAQLFSLVCMNVDIVKLKADNSVSRGCLH